MNDTLNGLLRRESESVTSFQFIDPPFPFNAPSVSQYPPETTGYYLIKAMCRRLGWPSLDGRKILDYGCGVRFARTIVNLGLDVGLYAGVDVNKTTIPWLRDNVKSPNLRFELFDMHNAMYNKTGIEISSNETLVNMGLVGFDLACMFSVITHQNPEDSVKIFKLLHQCVADGGMLYFTALTDSAVEKYVEANQEKMCLLSTYNPNYMLELVEASGWIVTDVFSPSTFQQTAYVCRK